MKKIAFEKDHFMKVNYSQKSKREKTIIGMEKLGETQFCDLLKTGQNI